MSTEKAKEQLELLLGSFGKDQLRAAAEIVLGKLETTRQIPAEYIRILHPNELAQTTSYLDVAVSEIVTAGKERENAYGNRAALIEERVMLETRIKLTEAEALINHVTPDGKNGILSSGRSVPLNNTEARDAFRRMWSTEDRKRLAEVEGELQKLEVETLKARDAWETAIQATEAVKAKANLQARLLQYLAGGAV